MKQSELLEGKHVMIDLETLATGEAAFIVSLALVGFDPFGDPAEILARALGEPDDSYNWFEWQVALDHRGQEERTIDADTVRWWLAQDPDVLKSQLFDLEKREPADVAAACCGYLTGFAAGQPLWLWSRGTDFDVRILEHFIRSHERELPWQHWRHQDVRTWERALDVFLDDGRRTSWQEGNESLAAQLPAHSARDDAMVAAYSVTLLNSMLQ